MIKDIEFFKIGDERWLGTDQMCNRYLRTSHDSIEVESVYRYGAKQPTRTYSAEEFKNWRTSVYNQ